MMENGGKGEMFTILGWGMSFWGKMCGTKI